MKTFLENLKKELKNQKMNESDIKEIIQDHEDMIKEAMDDGLKAEDISQKFGDPKDLAESLAEGYESNETDKGEKLLFRGQDIESLSVGFYNEDIRIERTNDEDVQVYGCNVIDVNYNIYLEDKTLHIERKNSNSIKFRIFRETGHFKVLIPNQLELKELKVHSKSSDVDLSDLTSENLNIHVVSGDLTLKKIQAKHFDFKTVSGDGDFDDCQFESLKASLVSADLDCNNLTIKNDFYVNTVSGDVEIDHGSCQEMHFHTVSGDLTGKEFYPEKVALKSVSGDIDISNSIKDKKIEIISKKTFSGDVNI